MPPSAQAFSIDIEVRHYELDTQGHVNSAVYLFYAEHARWRHLEAMGIGPEALAGLGVGPAFLELTIKYLRELRAGDTVTVSSELVFPDAAAKTFLIDQHLHRGDSVPVADIRCTSGLLDLSTRRLVENPKAMLGSLTATDAFNP